MAVTGNSKVMTWRAVVWYIIISAMSIVCYTISTASLWKSIQVFSDVYGMVISHVRSVLYSLISYVSGMGCNYISYVALKSH